MFFAQPLHVRTRKHTFGELKLKDSLGCLILCLGEIRCNRYSIRSLCGCPPHSESQESLCIVCYIFYVTYRWCFCLRIWTHTHRHYRWQRVPLKTRRLHMDSWYQSLAVWSGYAKSLNPYLWWMHAGMEGRGSDEIEIWEQLYGRLSTVLCEWVLTKIPDPWSSRRRCTLEIMSESALQCHRKEIAGEASWD